jgi:hypothetical protein
LIPVPRKDVIIAVSPKGDFIAVSHITNTGIINLRRKKFDRPVPGVSNRVISFTVFTVDGKSFYQGGNDPRFNLYNVRTRKATLERRIRLRGNYYVNHAMETASGYLACSGNSGFAVWTDRGKKLLLRVQIEGTRFRRIELTVDGKYAITPYGYWDLTTLQPILPFDISTVGKSLRLTPDAKRVLFVDGKTVYVVPALLPEVAVKQSPDN